MREKDSGYSFFQKSGDIFSGRIIYVVFQANIFFVDFQSIFVHSIEIGIVSGPQDVRIQRTGDQAYFFMPQLNQMLYCQLKAFLTVTAHGSDIRIFLDIIIIENRRNFRGSKLVYPGVQKAEAQHEGGLVPVFHHENTVRNSALKFFIQGKDIHDPALGLRHLLKAQNNIMAKLIGSLVFHIFHQNTDLFFFFLQTSVDIAHFHGSLQDFFTHFLAYVRGVVQSL